MFCIRPPKADNLSSYIKHSYEYQNTITTNKRNPSQVKSSSMTLYLNQTAPIAHGSLDKNRRRNLFYTNRQVLDAFFHMLRLIYVKNKKPPRKHTHRQFVSAPMGPFEGVF